MEEIIKFLIPRLSKEGHTIILTAFLIAIALWFFLKPLWWVGVLGFIFCLYFFRDPVRVTPLDENLIISPGDGIVTAIERGINYPTELEMGDKTATRVSIFLNVFNVHVNRIPVTGVITKSFYHPGLFLNASLDKSSKDNERHSLLITSKEGYEVGMVQIAGLIARRIVCQVKEGDLVKAGSRYGIIKFGSRLDLYLPDFLEPKVIVGQTMIGGETIIASFIDKQEVFEGRSE